MRQMFSGLMRMIPWSIRGQIKQIAGVAHLQRVVVSKALDGQEFTHRVDAGPAKGMTFHVRLPEDKGIWTGTYELEFASALAAAVQPGSVAYDIGGWHGFFAGVMAAQGARRVYVFEPLPDNVERVHKLIALNPDKAIELHACAVSDRDTEMDLMIMPETSMAKLEASIFQSRNTSDQRVRVAVRSIDSMIAAGEAEAPTLMKIDVEGAELMVLRGAINTLRTRHPTIFAEIHSSELLAECTQLLQGEGYTVESRDEDLDAACAKDIFQIQAVA